MSSHIIKSFLHSSGSVNLIGTFPEEVVQNVSQKFLLDPLCILSIDMALEMVTFYKNKGVWEKDPKLSLSPDKFHKYGFSGSGAYSVGLPCKGFDGELLLEEHHDNFVPYLRLCFRWGGFPGLERYGTISKRNLALLTDNLLPF
ncbi:hypothetical protein KDA_48940 [Dictyobacter alpinus]|uniref:Uncharacterized protein n=1 Tax=Dictyobacter alpinus TaxID=2014873 RepID=A0A402BDN0_9CHLR|nr:hypothetical protein [Dictyobacter alpinus]GCE29410.1 hypothetical protein KDA_48940 [Dictyobacter alpinus]